MINNGQEGVSDISEGVGRVCESPNDSEEEKDQSTELDQQNGDQDNILNVSEQETDACNGGTVLRKKKRRPRKKKNGGLTLQTNPPEVDISKIYTNGRFPTGELVGYTGTNSKRITDGECVERERLQEDDYNDLRRAAEVHRQVRSYMRGYLKPGMKMVDICEKLEDMVRKLINEDGLKSGIGFPTGCSLNDCAAHYTPNPGDETVLKYDDVMKLDFGTHVNGLIIDSAFTITFDPKYDPLLNAVKEATNAGIKEAGIDARFSEIGTAIQEVMESHQIELNGKTYDIKCVRNLCGHSISKYKIHAGRTLPIVRNNDETCMVEGELYAIETFGSTGKGYVVNKPDCSHYMLNPECATTNFFSQKKVKNLYNSILKNFYTLPFCRRYLARIGENLHAVPLSHLVRAGIIEEYPPLNDIRGSYVAQFEHTVLLRPTQKEILSRGDDY